MTRVLVHVGNPALASHLADRMPTLEIIDVDRESVPDPTIHGEVLLTLPWGSDNLGAVLERGVDWVHVLGTGVDDFPLDLLDGRRLTCSRGASAGPIAEFCVAAMLAVEKQLPEIWSAGPLARGSSLGLGGLQGRTVGVVGLGAIGLAVADRVAPFGAGVIACRRSDAPSPDPRVSLSTLEDVLAQSDHLVVAAAATPETRHLLDAAAIAQLRPGVHLINIARGSLIDQEALRPRLDAGDIARATLDVTEPEPLPDDHWLRNHPRVRVSPHVAWEAPGAVGRIVDLFVANADRYLTGEPLAGLVDPALRY
jgi:phosphoglycerate dehydrogenase-like enzyme